MANTLITASKNQILEDGLKIKNLNGIGINRANVIVSTHHSFSSVLKEIINDV